MNKIYSLTAKVFSLVSFCLAASVAQAQYCVVGPASSFDSNVESVTLVGNSSTISYTGCPGITGLENLTATDFTDLERGVTYTIDITWGYCNNNAYNGYGKVWIDFDGNQAFDASEEIVAVSVPNNSQPLVGTYTFTVPVAAAIGNTRMRVMQREGGSAAQTACQGFTWGSNTDFGINIIDCSAGPTFGTLSATSCGYYTAPSGAQLHDAGTYTDTIVNYLGCDSIITINLATNNTFSTITLTNLCGNYTMPSGLVVGVDGLYTDTTTNAAGCDSVIVYDLSFDNSSSLFSTTACNVYTAPSGAQYTLSGTYNDTINNAAGCDSVMTINLTMFFDNSLTIFVSTCGDPYTSDAGNVYPATGVYQENFFSANGCDSIVYIDLTVAEGNETFETIDACDEYTSDAGILYSASGVYQEVYTGATGCDSTLNLTININTVDQVANWVSAMTVEANETGATYQWVDCNNSNATIPGATTKIFIASVNGDYACMVTKNGCTEMTNCVRVGSLGVDEENNVFGIYPNPSSGQFIIELASIEANTSVEITNAAGQIVYQSSLNDTKTDISLENVEAGVYFVSVTTNNTTAKKAVLIQ
ncbi:MAG: T9SS type A sorting domain-containing protein [Crocinitomicaceae bacterium]